MKRFITVFSLIVLLSALAHGAEAPYTFQSIDITVPGHPELPTFPEDINDKGQILTNFRLNDVSQSIIAEPMNRRQAKFKSTTFSPCANIPFADARSNSLNDKAQVAGSCTDAAQAPSRESGFIRYPNGNHILLDFPGATTTTAYGISSDGNATGLFATPFSPTNRTGLDRIHCYIWDHVTNRYTQIDFPRADTYTVCWAINKNKKVLLEYVTYDPATNEYLEHGWALYSNGQFELLGLTYEHIGGRAQLFVDLNDDDTMIVERSNSGADATWDGIFLYDDGIFFEVKFPADWLVPDARGMNNLGQFVGTYHKQIGVTPLGTPKFESHGYIATPAPIAAVRKK